MNSTHEEIRSKNTDVLKVKPCKALWKKFDQVKDNPEERNKLFRERDRLEESGEAFTEEAKALIKEREQLFRKKVIWETEQASQHPSLVGLFILKMKVENARKDEDVIPYLEVFQKCMPPAIPNIPIPGNANVYRQ